MAITDNTQKINRLLEAINALPNAESGGVELPELTNPGTADDLMYGKELIGQNGEKITGNVQMIPSGNTGLIASTNNVSLVENNSSKYIDMEWTFPLRIAFDEQSALHVQSNTANFGDATAADVAAGKTFTSASGLKVVGTKENTAGGGNFFTTEVTLPSEHAAKSPKVLCTIPYIAEHINDPGLFVMLMRKDTSEMTLSVSVTMACNTAYLNSSYSMSILRSSYGIVGEYKSGAQEAYKLNNAGGTGMNRVYADSAGNIYILPYSSYSFIAGTYIVVYGVL